jgi:hypothetical protein
MTGWTGGVANRDWQRDRRTTDDGRIRLAADVATILAGWRESHNWQPGFSWDPRTATYRHIEAA